MTKPDNCPACNSKDIVKFGRILRAGGKVQRYACNDCGKIIVDVGGPS